MTPLRRFNEKGLATYRDFITSWFDDPATPTPTDAQLLLDPSLTETVDDGPSFERREFQDRYEFGVYLEQTLGQLSKDKITDDHLLWDWLAMFFFDQIKGSKDFHKYALSPNNYQKWHRHSVRINWQMVQAHGDACKWMLLDKLDKHGDFIEQPMARESIARNTQLLAVASRLYTSVQADGTIKVKRGARSSGKRDGDINRFVIWVQQIEGTYDLMSMDADSIYALLPTDDEFDHWLE